MVDTGACGRRSDAGILSDSAFGKKLGIPEPDKLPGSQEQTPYVFVGEDEAFPLKENMM